MTATVATEAPVLHAEAISMAFGGVKALDDVHIDLPRGVWTGLIGPNGSGKTTLLNVLSGIYRPSAGRIVVNGVDVSSASPRGLARAGIARTFQHPQLAGSLTILENVVMGADLGRRRSRQDPAGRNAVSRAHGVLDRLGCDAYAGHLPAEAPYGVRKAAEVARALMARPAVLLLDEPAAGLSREERKELVDVLRATAESQPDMAVCLVEHDVRLVAAVCTVLQALNFGRVLAVGTVEQVLSNSEVKTAYLGKSTRLHTQESPA